MVLARNPVHSALFLVLTVLITIAVLFLLQGAQLVATVQVIVYASAIVVLFLFVIMLLGVDRTSRSARRCSSSGPRPSCSGWSGWPRSCSSPATSGLPARSRRGSSLHAGTGGNIERVARSLFTDFLWPFEVTAVLLVVAVVGWVVLARRSGLPPDLDFTEGDDDDIARGDERVDAESEEVSTP